MAILNNNPLIGSGGQQGYSINNSLRFRSSASAYLNRTPASAGNRKTYTYSFWAKYSTGSSDATFFSTYGGSSGTFFSIGFAAGGTAFDIDEFNGSTRNVRLTTTQVFRDPSAWYHFVVAIDTTQATSSNRVKIYVNGNQVTAFSSATYPSQNFDTYVNTTQATNIGRRVDIPGLYLDGYLAETYFIDGSAKTPSDFGETDTTTGVWKPKAYSGTYGTNGFYLKFSDIATTSGSNAGLGKDFSGNSNYWTTNNISVTSGTTYDAMTDSPTNTSATVANYCVLNPLDKTAGTVSNGNLTIVKGSTGAFANIRGTISVSSGKWYYETTLTSGINYSTLGILSPDVAFPSQIGDSAYGWDWYPAFAEKKNNGTGTSYGTTASAGDVIMCAFDVTNGKIWWGKNGTWFASGDPAAGTNAAFTNVTGTVAPAVAVSGTSTQLDVNFGQRPFAYTPPTGFVALNTYNLPTPTILQGNKYMDATLWTGNGTSQTITNAGGFKPDFVWSKNRSSAGYFHDVVDSVRGANTRLCPNSTQAEDTASNAYLTAFNSNGFNIGSNSDWNRNADTYVGWQWQAGQGSTSSNTSGTITSTVSVNASAGFSVVTYSGNGASGATVGHGLGVAPKMMIVKCRTSGTNSWTAWQVYHASLTNPATSFLRLNETSATYTGFASAWNSTAPTSSVFSVSYAGGAGVNGSGDTFVAYCWAEISGYSKFGSYTGNGSTDGVFVYLGFRPKFIITKVYSTSGYNWNMYDSSRGTYNVADQVLVANGSGAEETGFDPIDFLSNGFKLRMGNRGSNVSGASYIYMAFAENPFKNSLAR